MDTETFLNSFRNFVGIRPVATGIDYAAVLAVELFGASKRREPNAGSKGLASVAATQLVAAWLDRFVIETGSRLPSGMSVADVTAWVAADIATPAVKHRVYEFARECRNGWLADGMFLIYSPDGRTAIGEQFVYQTFDNALQIINGMSRIDLRTSEVRLFLIQQMRIGNLIFPDRSEWLPQIYGDYENGLANPLETGATCGYEPANENRR